jgi:hypothetical protein
MKAEPLPAAFGRKPFCTAPISIQTCLPDDGQGFGVLRLVATGLGVTACLTPGQLRSLSAMAAAAAAELEACSSACGGSNVISIFTPAANHPEPQA